MTSGYDWTGTVGDAWAAEWRRTDRSFADLSPRLNAAILEAAPAGAFRALDIGCGAGGTTLALAEARPDATITGVDLSAGLVEVARQRLSLPPTPLPRRRPGPSFDDGAENIDKGGNWAPAFAGEQGRGNIEFRVADAIAAAGDLVPLDLLYSRHGVMFFDDPFAAFTSLHAAAGSNAALVFSCFADWPDNAFASALAGAIGSPPPTPLTPGPFAFADREHVATLLVAAGWRDAIATRVPFTYRAGEGEGDAAIADALSFFPADRPHRTDPSRRFARRSRPPARPGHRRHPRSSSGQRHRLPGLCMDMVGQGLTIGLSTGERRDPHRPPSGEQPVATRALAARRAWHSLRGQALRAEHGRRCSPPPELRKVHPLGKSPVIEDEGRVIAETGAIVEYLVEKADGRLGPPAHATACCAIAISSITPKAR